MLSRYWSSRNRDDLSKYPERNKDYTVQFDFVENNLSTFLGDQILDKKLFGQKLTIFKGCLFSYLKEDVLWKINLY